MTNPIRILLPDGESQRFAMKVGTMAEGKPFELLIPKKAGSEDVVAMAADVDAILAYKAPLTREVILAARKARMIQKFGLDCKNIDLAAAREKGLPVFTRSLIRNATVVDGTGAPRRNADVAVKDDRIMAVGDLSREKAGVELDAGGRVLAASDQAGLLTERVSCRMDGQTSGVARDPRTGTVTAFHRTPGYETYRGLGWYGMIVQTDRPFPGRDGYGTDDEPGRERGGHRAVAHSALILARYHRPRQ